MLSYWETINQIIAFDLLHILQAGIERNEK